MDSSANASSPSGVVARLLDWKYALVLSLTLGLAPFVPEPQIAGKLRWVAGGANGMAVMDWLDLLWHGWPWIWLILAMVYRIRR